MKRMVGIKVPSFHPNSWSMDLIDSNLLKEEEKGMVLCGCWSIWNERNKRRHGEGQRTIQALVQWVMQTTIDLAHVGKEKSKKPLTKKAKWKSPDQSWVKINTDACYHQVAQAGSTGLVVKTRLACAPAWCARYSVVDSDMGEWSSPFWFNGGAEHGELDV
jgi:hypothetical protein